MRLPTTVVVTEPLTLVSQEVAFCLLLHVCIKYVNNHSTKQLINRPLFCIYCTEIIAEFSVSIVGDV